MSCLLQNSDLRDEKKIAFLLRAAEEELDWVKSILSRKARKIWVALPVRLFSFYKNQSGLTLPTRGHTVEYFNLCRKSLWSSYLSILSEHDSKAKALPKIEIKNSKKQSERNLNQIKNYIRYITTYRLQFYMPSIP